jgi:hypothetical protein
MKRNKEAHRSLFLPSETLYPKLRSSTFFSRNDDVERRIHRCSPISILGDELMTFVETQKQNGTTAAVNGLTHFIGE